jgi:hypothetical protein
LQVELGNFMQTIGPDRTVKNKWLWQGMNRMDIQVINVAENDIAELMAQGIDMKNSDRFISANLLSKETGQPLLKPYAVKNISLSGNPRVFRLGFLGISARENFFKTDELGYVWDDPLASAKKWLPELRQKCDFVVLLACIPQREAVQLAVDTSSIDIIIDGFKHQSSTPPASINKSTIVYAEDEGRVLGELRFAVGAGSGDVKPLMHVLTRNMPDDPEMARFIAKAKTEISEVQNQLAKGTGSSPVKVEPAFESDFITSVNCAPCHQAAFDVWSKSKHAHAIEILVKEKKQFDTSCVVCHVTGSGKPGGFLDLYKTAQLANVQCEACHGTGREHRLNPSSAKAARVSIETCVVCHTKSNSPEFEFASYWEKIKH